LEPSNHFNTSQKIENTSLKLNIYGQSPQPYYEKLLKPTLYSQLSHQLGDSSLKNETDEADANQDIIDSYLNEEMTH
jgi:hypothetical protein